VTLQYSMDSASGSCTTRARRSRARSSPHVFAERLDHGRVAKKDNLLRRQRAPMTDGIIETYSALSLAEPVTLRARLPFVINSRTITTKSPAVLGVRLMRDVE
jgi:hypothetical protein